MELYITLTMLTGFFFTVIKRIIRYSIFNRVNKPPWFWFIFQYTSAHKSIKTRSRSFPNGDCNNRKLDAFKAGARAFNLINCCFNKWMQPQKTAPQEFPNKSNFVEPETV